jgi:4-amino-4-deoxy-L-arabinose transferase-like glycosyltransferase
MGKKGKKKVIKTDPVIKTQARKKSAAISYSRWPWLAVLTVITAISFFPMLQNNFTNWDDDFYVVNNALLRGPDWSGIFSQPVVSNYHPLTVLSLALNYAVSGTEAWSYLLLNLMLHIFNVILVFKFIYSISGNKRWVAFFTAWLFAVHPLHVESVAWISERKDVLYTFFFLLSLLQYWKYLQTGKSKWLWICFLFFMLSLLSKPAAIVLPFVLFLLDYWKQRPFHKKIIIEKIPFLLAAVLFTVITLRLQSVTAIMSLDQYPLWVRFFFASYVIMIYFIRFFIPYPLSSFHPFPPPDHLGWAIYISPLFVAALAGFIWYFRKNRVIIFGLVFFLVNIALVLQLISIGFTIVSERYTYIPYIGLAFLIFMWLEKYMTVKKMVPFQAAVGIICILFMAVSFQRTKVWKNSDTLWSDVIRHYPDAAMPRGMRAQNNYNKALLMNPADARPVFQQVVEDCSVAIHNSSETDSLKKGGRSMHYMRANAYNSLQQYDKALEDFNACIYINPNDDEVLYLRGSLLVNQFQKYAAALEDFSKAIQLNPQGKYFLNRSICNYKMGNMANAKADAQTALQKGTIIPDNYRQALNL